MGGIAKASRILVAGHTGLIGSAVVRRLNAEGYGAVLTWPRGRVDLRDAVQVRLAFEEDRPEYVVLAAGRVGGIVENQREPAAFIDDNLAMQLHVLQAARATGVAKLILFGSSCMYPRECPQPMAEDQLLSGRPEPTSLPYAMAKLAGVHQCLAYNQQDRAQRFLPLIPNTAYGPHDNFDPGTGHVLSALMARFHAAAAQGARTVSLWGTGSARREFVHADDIADACLCLLERDVSGLEFPVNVGVGDDVSIKALAERIAALVGFEGRLEWDASRPEGAPRKLLDSTRIRAFGWTPKVGWEDGLRMTYEWYRQHVAATAGVVQ